MKNVLRTLALAICLVAVFGGMAFAAVNYSNYTVNSGSNLYDFKQNATNRGAASLSSSSAIVFQGDIWMQAFGPTGAYLGETYIWNGGGKRSITYSQTLKIGDRVTFRAYGAPYTIGGTVYADN